MMTSVCQITKFAGFATHDSHRCSCIRFIYNSMTLFEVMGKQKDYKCGVDTTGEACPSIASTGKSILCSIFIDSPHADVRFEFLSTTME